MLKNQITQSFSLALPIWQAPLPFDLFHPAYSGTISDQGGLGLIRVTEHENEANLKNKIAAYTANSDKLGICFMHRLPKHTKASVPENIPASLETDDELMEIDEFDTLLNCALSEQPTCIGFANGLPEQEVIDTIQAQNCQTFAICHNLLEALVCEKMNIDIIVLKGSDAGGDCCSFDNDIATPTSISSFSLLQQARSYISKPIVLWGDFSHGADIIAAIISGAQAVMIDRLLLNCADSGLINEQYLKLSQATEYQSAVKSYFNQRKMRYIKDPMIPVVDLPLEHREQIYEQYFLEHPNLRPLSVCQTKCKTSDSLADRFDEIQKQIKQYLS